MFVKATFGLEAAETGFGVAAEKTLIYLGFFNRVSELEQASVQVPNSFTVGPSAGLVVF